MVSSEEEFNQHLESFRNLTKTTYFPVTEEGDGGLTVSKFAGQPWLAPDETWPRCGNCDGLLQFFFQLNLGMVPREAKANFGDNGLLQLFYCLDCEDSEPFANTRLVRMVYPDVTNERDSAISVPTSLEAYPTRTIIAWEPLEEFPEFDELRNNPELILDDKQRFARDQLKNDSAAIDDYWPRSELGDKLGGWPHWIQGAEYYPCPQCQKQMQVVFQLDSEDNLPYMFGDSGCSYIIQCPVHREQLGYFWACM
jgi:uncharacterized protein YwqG